MTLIRTAIVFLSLAAVAPPSFAGACDKIMAADALIRCLGDEFSNADKKLNAVYSSLRTGLPQGAKAVLKKAQQSWLSYRDQDCEFEAASSTGGSAYQPMFISCQIARTKQRVEQLQYQAKLWPK